MPKKKKTKEEAVAKWAGGITDAGAKAYNQGVAAVSATDFADAVKGKDDKWAENTAAAVRAAGTSKRWSAKTAEGAGAWKAGVKNKGTTWLKNTVANQDAYLNAIGKVIDGVIDCEGEVTPGDVEQYRQALMMAGGQAEKRARNMSVDALRGDLVRMCLSGKAKAGKLKGK